MYNKKIRVHAKRWSMHRHMSVYNYTESLRTRLSSSDSGHLRDSYTSAVWKVRGIKWRCISTAEDAARRVKNPRLGTTPRASWRAGLPWKDKMLPDAEALFVAFNVLVYSASSCLLAPGEDERGRRKKCQWSTKGRDVDPERKRVSALPSSGERESSQSAYLIVIRHQDPASLRSRWERIAHARADRRTDRQTGRPRFLFGGVSNGEIDEGLRGTVRD